jgi:6-phosphogluconolactonase
VRPELLVFPDAASAGRALAAATAKAANASLERSDRFSWVVSGGKSPEPYWDALATQYSTEVPWDRVHLFWADERAVPAGDPESNVGAVRRKLLSRLPIPEANVHPIHGEITPPTRAAAAYDRELRSYFGTTGALPERGFDLVTLGLGPDGHTASLFPAPFPSVPPGAWVASTPPAPVPPAVPRITLGPDLLDRSVEVAFLVTGSEKRDILGEVLGPSARGASPAGRVRALHRVRWFVDAGAAGPLDRR